MKISGTMKGEIDVKRFYLSGMLFESFCKICGERTIFDGDDNYLSYPIIGNNKIHFYCCQCDEEWDIPINLSVKVTSLSTQAVLKSQND